MVQFTDTEGNLSGIIQDDTSAKKVEKSWIGAITHSPQFLRRGALS
jgi:hypothetical protein